MSAIQAYLIQHAESAEDAAARTDELLGDSRAEISVAA